MKTSHLLWIDTIGAEAEMPYYPGVTWTGPESPLVPQRSKYENGTISRTEVG